MRPERDPKAMHKATDEDARRRPDRSDGTAICPSRVHCSCIPIHGQSRRLARARQIRLHGQNSSCTVPPSVGISR